MAKQDIRKKTDNFLSNSMGSITFPNAPSSSVEYKEVNESDAALTGAIGAELPMRISMTGQNGQRIELVLLINPENMNHGKTQTVQPLYTRNGFVVQPWGYNLDTLSATGKSAGFMAATQGLTGNNKIYSFGYTNFLGLMNAYKNNGYTFFDSLKTNSRAFELTRLIGLVHGVEIFYDGTFMMGHFSNFTLNEMADQPFFFSYNFEFVISVLDGDYTEMRGHFEAVPVNASKPTGILRLLSDIDKPNRTIVETMEPEVYMPDNTNVISSPPPTAKKNPQRVYDKYKDIILDAAKTWKVDPKLLGGMVTQESNGDPNAVSKKSGAIGLMQLMPENPKHPGAIDAARRAGILPANFDPKDPRDSIMVGAWYLSTMLRQFGGNEALALSAYNGGPGATRKYMAKHGTILQNKETKEYVLNVPYYKRLIKD